MTTKTLLRSLSLMALLASPPAAAFATIAVAAAPNLAFQHPQVSGDGRVAVMERRWAQAFVCYPEPCAEQFEIIVADLGDNDDCGQDVLRELSRDAVSRDPSITFDGSRVAYRSLVAGVQRLRVASSNGHHLFDYPLTTSPISSLEIDPTGRYLYYYRSGSGIERVDTQVPSPRRIAPEGPGTQVILSDNYPVDRFGSVYYVRREGGIDRLWRQGLTGSRVFVYQAPANVTLGDVSVDPAGTRLVFTYGSATSRRLMLYFLANGPAVFLTPAVDGAVSMSHVSMARDGLSVTFASNGNFVGQNADRSEEVYSISLDLLPFRTTQVTTFANTPPPLPRVQEIVGTATATGRNVWYAGATCSSLPCTWTQGASDPQRVLVASYWPLRDPPVGISSIVTPPFDFLTADCGSTGAPPVAECKVHLRNANEATRTLFVRTEFELADGFGGSSIVSQDVEPFTVSLDIDSGPVTAVSIARSSAAMPGAPLKGIFRVFATDTHNVAADRAVAEIPFSF